MSSIGVLGAGTWGVALARMLSNCGHKVTVWSRNASEISNLSSLRRHKNLPDMLIPLEIVFTSDLADACRQKDILLFAVPSVGIRAIARTAAPFVPDGQIIVNVSKGLEPGTHLTMTQVISSEMDAAGRRDVRLAALSGPTHAEEVAKDLPTTIISACDNLHVAEIIQDVFMNSCMRVYTNQDVEGVELCGAVKNVIALAAGISAGLGYGDNAKAALITRGMAEIKRLGLAMGCHEETFSGLAGIGDLIVTATSVHSRNNRCGILIGQGVPPDEATRQIGMVVEGLHALTATVQLAQKYKITMPIVQAVNDVINHGADPRTAVSALMSREKKSEYDSSDLVLQYEHAILQTRRENNMKRVITYGTFDLLHYGHINLLRRAKALGDYLIVCLSTDEFNWNQKHKKSYFSYEKRKQLLEAVRYVDLVIPEENWEQKIDDIKLYKVDTFVMGDDWEGKFDFLKEYCDVVYLPRTPEISSSQIKEELKR